MKKLFEVQLTSIFMISYYSVTVTFNYFLNLPITFSQSPVVIASSISSRDIQLTISKYLYVRSEVTSTVSQLYIFC